MPLDAFEVAQRRRAVVAALLYIAAMLLVMLGLVHLTPLTMTVSVGVAGGLLALACATFVIGVVVGLRRRQIL